MKSGYIYESPTAEVMTLAVESVLCSSPVFGQDGGPGNDFFDADDITDGGTV